MSEKYKLLDAIQNTINHSLFNINTAIPGEITKVDTAKQLVNVKVALKRLVDGTEYEIPELEDVPLMYPRTKVNGLSYQVDPGDNVLLIFCQRNINDWKKKGAGSIPPDARKFDISDAIAIPGINPEGDAYTLKEGTELLGDNIFIGDSSKEIVLEANEIKLDASTVSIGSDSAELVDILSQTLQVLSTQVFPTPVGPSGPSTSAADFVQLKTKLDTIKA